MTDQEPGYYLEEELNQSVVYTEDDCYLYDLDCMILNDCRQGIVPQLEEV